MAKVSKTRKCPTCAGFGERQGARCPTCKGTGEVPYGPASHGEPPVHEYSVRDHILLLEGRIAALESRSMEHQLDLEQRNKLQATIRAANLALGYYRAALVIEQTLAAN
jgi:hypothetical protein